jgi:hypothetical protein
MSLEDLDYGERVRVVFKTSKEDMFKFYSITPGSYIDRRFTKFWEEGGPMYAVAYGTLKTHCILCNKDGTPVVSGVDKRFVKVHHPINKTFNDYL